ncbi:MAG TPA: hypothetical protein VII36_01885 [Usitatibacter sp.]
MKGRHVHPESTRGTQFLSSMRIACFALALAPGLSRAALSDEIQVYDDDINAPHVFGLELHANTTPEGRSVPDYPGEVVPNHGLRLTPEFSYGLTRAWEAGLYVPSSFDSAGRGSLAGWKLRLKWLALHPDEGAAGWFAGANGELSRLQEKFSASRDAFELRTIGGYRADAWLLAVNPVFGWDLSPGFRGAPDFSLGVKATHDIADKVAVGAEYYSEMGKTTHILPLREQANTLFGVIDLQVKSFGIDFGIGRGLTGSADKWTVKAIFAIPL